MGMLDVGLRSVLVIRVDVVIVVVAAVIEALAASGG